MSNKKKIEYSVVVESEAEGTESLFSSPFLSSTYEEYSVTKKEQGCNYFITKDTYEDDLMILSVKVESKYKVGQLVEHAEIHEIDSIYVREDAFRYLTTSSIDFAEHEISEYKIFFDNASDGCQKLISAYVFSEVSSGDWIESILSDGLISPEVNHMVLLGALHRFCEWDDINMLGEFHTGLDVGIEASLQDSDKKDVSLQNVLITKNGNSILISAQGYEDVTSKDYDAPIVIISHYGNELEVKIWPDKNEEEGKSISLLGAKSIDMEKAS